MQNKLNCVSNTRDEVKCISGIEVVENFYSISLRSNLLQ